MEHNFITKMELSENILKQHLPNRTFRYFDTIDSTQTYALNWLENDATAGTLVIADEQTQGRGRHGRVWYTPPGAALAVSLILKPDTEQLSQVTMLAAVAIVDVLDKIGCEGAEIKWPNDVLIKGHKVCGILPESVWEGNRLKGVALGMGINIRNDFSTSGLNDIATTIEAELGERVNRLQVLLALIDRLGYWCTLLGSSKLYEAWRNRLVTLGKSVALNGVVGLAEDVNDDGAILIRDAENRLHTIVVGEV